MRRGAHGYGLGLALAGSVDCRGQVSALLLVGAGHAVRFAPAYRLVQDFLAAERNFDLPRQLRKLDNFDFLLLDSLGYPR